jgi:hypothetical protein
MDIHVSTLVGDAGLDVVGIAAGAGRADVLVSVQGDGVIQYDAVKEVGLAAAARGGAHGGCGAAAALRAHAARGARLRIDG